MSIRVDAWWEWALFFGSCVVGGFLGALIHYWLRMAKATPEVK